MLEHPRIPGYSPVVVIGSENPSGADNQQERSAPLSKEYVAGILTGEGYFGLTICKKHHSVKMRQDWKIMPRFALHMNDEETMRLIRESFEVWGLKAPAEGGHKGRRIGTAGCKSVLAVAVCFLPHLTGTKKKAAEMVAEFCARRTNCGARPYSERDIFLVNQLRAVNGGNYANKRLLKSSETNTPDTLFPTRSVKIESGLHGDMQRAAEMIAPAA